MWRQVKQVLMPPLEVLQKVFFHQTLLMTHFLQCYLQTTQQSLHCLHSVLQYYQIHHQQFDLHIQEATFVHLPAQKVEVLTDYLGAESVLIVS